MSGMTVLLLFHDRARANLRSVVQRTATGLRSSSLPQDLDLAEWERSTRTERDDVMNEVQNGTLAVEALHTSNRRRARLYTRRPGEWVVYSPSGSDSELSEMD